MGKAGSEARKAYLCRRPRRRGFEAAERMSGLDVGEQRRRRNDFLKMLRFPPTARSHRAIPRSRPATRWSVDTTRAGRDTSGTSLVKSHAGRATCDHSKPQRERVVRHISIGIAMAAAAALLGGVAGAAGP